MGADIGGGIMADRPPKADFAIVIDFARDEASPQRIFQAADALITAFQEFDQTLVKSIDSSIEPIMILEDIEASSLKIWLRNSLQASEDQALKELDWKPQVGKYLVKAKYILLDFVNHKIKVDDDRRLVQLRQDLNQLAQETDVRHLPDYAPVSGSELITNVASVSGAKARLSKKDGLRLISDEGEKTFNTDIEWSPEDMKEMFVKETVKRPPYEMILLVKRPDYIGNAKWEFRHGRARLFAKIDHENWLRQFQARQVDVRPGDALRCSVEQEVQYGFDNEVIGENYSVIQVLEVIENRTEQPDLLVPPDG
jgi:hypothetical protein